MNRILLFLFISFLCNDIEAQTWFVGWDTVPAKFRLDASPFQFGGGPLGVNTNSDLPEAESFILSKNSKGFFVFQFDLQAIFKDKIGFETGFDFISGGLNENAIRNEFQNHIPNYSVNIPKDNNHTGDSPFSGGYDFSIFKLGLVGFLPFKKVHIVPYLDYLYNIESNYPSLKVEFTDVSSTTVFTREYQFYNTRCNGFKLGTSIRGYFKNSNKKIKHANLYMQLRAEFVYLKTNGYGYYVDKDINKNETRSESHKFNQNIYAFVIGVTLGGLDLHW